MPRIESLPTHIVNQIAAGEVVERPASVVKELVENALDAGATEIRVRIEEGGRRLIEVLDDGWGMDREDLERVFLPHATSKVRSVEDLAHVGTLGFRGEALASIGSVADVAIRSREPDAEEAWQVVNRFGEIRPPEPAAGPPGTRIQVANLFGHVPARRKFLRAASTEAGHVNDLVSRLALAHPQVAFHLHHGSRAVRTCPAVTDRRMRIGQVYGASVAEPLLEVRSEAEDMTLEAWVGPPHHTRGDGRLEQVYLNGRHVRDKACLHAIREAYRDLLPPGGRRPIAFVFLTCDPGLVDVNVHPAKAEVRWRETGVAHRVVRRGLRAVLERAAPGMPVALGAPRAVSASSAPLPLSAGGVGGPATGWRDASALPAVPSTADLLREMDGAEAPRIPATPDAAGEAITGEGLRPRAQVLGTYLVLEGDDELVLIDQHALHERVLFDQINDRLRAGGGLEVQRLLVPQVVTLDPASCARLLEASAWLATLGWVVEPFGEDTVALQGVPAVMRRPDGEAALREILEVLERGAREGLDRAALLSETVDRMACRGAIMAGDVLDPSEVLALLAQAEALNHQHSCPHGRPTRLTLRRADLERHFHRV